jgi:catalase
LQQAAFEPDHIVPGTGLAPDKMLPARGFSYPMRTGPGSGSKQQIPVNSPKVEVHSYSKDGASRLRSDSARVYVTTATIRRLSEENQR